MKRSTIVILVSMFTLLLSMWLWVSHIRDEQAVKDLNLSPAGTSLIPGGRTGAYTDFAGNAVSLQDELGKVIVVYSWASWCPQCVEDLKTFNTLAQNNDRPEIKFIAINRAESAATAERFLNKLVGDDLTFELLLDDRDVFFSTRQGRTMSELVIFNEMGAVVYETNTAIDKSSIQTLLDQELEKETE